MISQIKRSLINCKVKKLEAVLVHNEDIVYHKNYRKIIKILKLIKKRGLTKKIGISIYDFEILKKFEKKLSAFDIINLPYNVFDRRLENKKIIKIVKKNNFELHVRSIFLQGYLVKKFSKLPKFFKTWKKNFSAWQEFLRKNQKTPQEVCLNFVFANPNVKKVILGVDSNKQLENLISLIDRKIKKIPNFHIDNKSLLIRPHLWA